MESHVILMVCSILACFFGVLSVVCSMVSLLKVMAFEKSTHTVVKELVPLDDEIDRANQEFLKKQQVTDPLDEGWATAEEAFRQQQEMYREDLEDQMPEFIEEDLEKVSF